MMRMRLLSLASGMAIITAGIAGAKDRVGGSYLRIPLSVRQMGMGDVSLGGRDVLRAWSNPAVLADQDMRGEVAVSGGSMFAGGQTTGGLGLGWRVGQHWVIGFLASYFTLSSPEYDEMGDRLANNLSQDAFAGGLTAAVNLSPVRAGLTIKNVSENLAGSKSSAMAVDLGGIVGLGKDLMGGLALRNIGGKIWGESLPSEMRAGLFYSVVPLRMAVGGEYVLAPANNAGSGACLGAGWWPASFFGLRAGVAGLGRENATQVTCGFSVVYGGLMLDFAFATHSLGSTSRISLAYSFGGRVTAQPAVVAHQPEPAPQQVAPAIPPPALELVPATEPVVPVNLAVAELTPQNVSAGESAIISDMLRNYLVATGRFNVVEKQSMDKILAEQAFQQTGCTNEECAVKLGKLLNVQRMVVGSFGKLVDKYFVSIRVVDVETGKVLFGDMARGRSVEEIEAGVKEMATRMPGSVR